MPDAMFNNSFLEQLARRLDGDRQAMSRTQDIFRSMVDRKVWKQMKLTEEIPSSIDDVESFLNAKNILGVYNATGDPDDDGYLTSSKYQQEILNQLDPEAFIQMYQIYVNNGGHYSTPRQIKIGASFNF